ncbi:MAG: helix-turn-helix domain-containing protein [Jiangellales bacterium]
MQRLSRHDVRAEFVGIAADLFAEHGFAATSLDDIAAEADYSKAAVLYHFGSKDDLLVAVMEHHIEQISDLLDKLETEPASPTRVSDAIEALATFALLRRPTLPLAFSPAQDVATAMARHPDLLESFREVRERMGRLLVGDEPSLAQRVRLVVAFSGLPAVLIELRDIPAEQLHGPICGVLRDAVHTKET